MAEVLKTVYRMEDDDTSIKVIRYDYPRREIKTRSGEVVNVIPEHHDVSYFLEETKLAEFRSLYDVLYLNHRCIGKDRSKSDYQKALEGQYKDAFAFLFKVLGIDETSNLSEYCDV